MSSVSDTKTSGRAISEMRQAGRVNFKNSRHVILHFGKKTIVLSLSPSVLIGACLFLISLAAFNAAAGFYLFQRDDLMARHAQAEMEIRQAYEARLQNFKVAMQAVENQSAEERALLAERLAALSSRQAQFAARSAQVAAVIDNARKMGVQVASVTAPLPTIKPGGTPMLADSDIRLGGDETAVGGELDGPDTLPVPEIHLNDDQTSLLSDPLAQISAYKDALDNMEHMSFVSLHTIENAIRQEHQAYGAALNDLPIDIAVPGKNTALGGPFLPVRLDEDAISASAKRMEVQLRDIDRMKALADDLPIAMPLTHAVRTSSFGRRIDPFRRRAAFHSGVDFRGRTGTPVLATADGKVIRAGRAGGYGNLVEIRHAHGLTTRYAHLHRISVKVGEQVERGEIIGKVGSTGRSTGPHLHYEVRQRGKARNPQPFMNAGKDVPHL